ncbi:MAG: NAD(P)-dependent alcohol dehydrogenase [Candidatus Bathyarchaeia archaeon]
MKAMRLVDVGKLQLMEVEVPKVGGSEVLVKVQAAGVCHSDVHIRRGYVGKVSIKDLGFKFPITLGHEVAGVVEETGGEVEGFAKGDVVVINSWIGCGACYFCKTGEENLCDNQRQVGINIDGGFAEYVKVPHYKYLFKIKHLSPVDAAPLACAGTTSYRAVRKAELDPSKFLTVIGAGGGVGHMVVQIAKAVSGATIIGVDVREEALKIAERAGADYVVDGRMDNVVEEIMKLTGGRGSSAIIDLNNSEKTLSVYPSALAKRGKYIMVGLAGADLKYPSAMIVSREAQFMGSWVGSQADFMGVMSLAEKGKVKPIVTKIRKLEEANEALDDLEHGRVAGRQVLVP